METDRLLRITRALLFPALLCGTRALKAQEPSVFDSIQTPHGVCHVWVGIPGGTGTEDLSYARCALDRPPRMLSAPELPQPLIGSRMNGDFTVVVNADGSVDRKLTRAWSIGMDSVAYRRALDGLRAWRFRPGIRARRAVRGGFRLRVETDARVDTLPSRLRWSYRTVPFGTDTLRGTWVADPAAVPPLAPARRDSVYAAIYRSLMSMRVIVPGMERSYCLVTPDPGAEAAWGRALPRGQRDAFEEGQADGGPWREATGGCEQRPGTIRLFLSRPHATEDDRVVLGVAGDYLADWPPGFGGPTYAGWSGRCVARAPAGAPAWANCDVSPRHAPPQLLQAQARPSPRWYRPGDPIRVTVVAMTRGSFQSDTLRTVVKLLPRLSRQALVDHAPTCSSAWNAYTAQAGGRQYVVRSLANSGWPLDVTRVVHGPPPTRPRPEACARKLTPDSALALFFLGDVGDPVKAPVTFCLGEPFCALQYRVDPARHTLAARAHLRVRMADLRPGSRTGDQLVFRITVDPVPEGLMPLVLIRSANWHLSLSGTRRVALDTWEYGVTFDPRYPPDTEAAIYIVAR